MSGAVPPRVPTTVLVVVRGPSFRAQLRGFLASDGHRIVMARTTRQALKLVSDSAPRIDWLLIDSSAGNTRSLASDAIAQNPCVRVLLLSGEPEYAGRADIPDVRVEFIEKPFAWRELKRKIDDLLAPRRGPWRAAGPGRRLASA